MKIYEVSVHYGETRSKGHPEYSNKYIEIGLSASLQYGDTANGVKSRLFEIAKAEVGRQFQDLSDKNEINEMDVPF
jgi:hypothetical protein